MVAVSPANRGRMQAALATPRLPRSDPSATFTSHDAAFRGRFAEPMEALTRNPPVDHHLQTVPR